MKRLLKVFACLGGLVPALASGNTLYVGPGQAYSKPSQALNAAQTGDTIVIAEGTWVKDFCYCPNVDNITIKGAGIDKTVLDADIDHDFPYAGGVHIAGYKGIWVVTGKGWTIEGVTFKNAWISAGDGNNGAGIRYEGDGPLTIRNCSFVGNQNGILCGALPNAVIRIENSLFRNNGSGDGFSHNLYIGVIKELYFYDCISDHANQGHALKSRALLTDIRNSVFDDGHDGLSNYLVNCPQGGDVTIYGCTFVQSEDSPNQRMISIADGDGTRHPGSVVYAENNTFTNYRHSCVEMFVGSGIEVLKLSDRIEPEPFVGEVTGGEWKYGTYDPDTWEPCGVNLLASATTVTNRLFAWNGDNNTPLKNDFSVLTDGSVPGSSNETLDYDGIYALSGGRAFWTLPAATDLKMVRITSRWRDGGRDGIDIKGVYARRASDNGLVVVSTNAVAYGTADMDGNNNSSGHLMAVLARPDGEALISDVTQIIIEFNGSQDNGGTGFVEIEAVASVSEDVDVDPVEDDKPVKGEWSYGSYELTAWSPSVENALIGKTPQVNKSLYSGDQQPGNNPASLSDGYIPADGSLSDVVGLVDNSWLTYDFPAENVKAITINSLWKDGQHDGMYVRGLDLKVGGAWVCIAGDNDQDVYTGVPRGDCGRTGYDDASGWTSAVKLGGNDSSGHLFLRFAAPDDKCLAKNATGLRIRFRQLDNGGTGFAEIEMDCETAEKTSGNVTYTDRGVTVSEAGKTFVCSHTAQFTFAEETSVKVERSTDGGNTWSSDSTGFYAEGSTAKIAVRNGTLARVTVGVSDDPTYGFEGDSLPGLWQLCVLDNSHAWGVNMADYPIGTVTGSRTLVTGVGMAYTKNSWTDPISEASFTWDGHDNFCYVYTGYMRFNAGNYKFKSNIDDVAYIKIGETEVHKPSDYTENATSEWACQTAGWYPVVLLVGDNTSGAGPRDDHSADDSFHFSTDGGTTWNRFMDPGDGSLFRVTAASTNSTVVTFPETTWTTGDYNPETWKGSLNNALKGLVSSTRPTTYDADKDRDPYVNDLASLTDGKIPSEMNSTDVFGMKYGTLEYTLAKAEDIKEIRFNSLWWDGGRDAMKVGAVSVKIGSTDAQWRTLAENGVSAGFDNNNSSGAIYLALAAKDGGVLAEDVVAVKFEFPDAQDNGGVGYAEIEVIREASGEPWTETQDTEVPVPYVWLNGFYPNQCSTDGEYEALAAGNGANGRPVWESYLAGLDPTDAASQLVVTIRMDGDDPIVEWNVTNQNIDALGYTYRVKGKAELSDAAWSAGIDGHRFFKVFIEKK